MTGQRPIFDPDRIRGPQKIKPTSKTLTVSQLNAMVKRILGDELPSTLYLVGEISNLARPASGHLYLTLKDDRSELRCVMWRSSAASLKFKPADGLEVIATGHVDIYAPRGQYQFSIRKLEPRGEGALELAFQQLKNRLEQEGLFDPARKKTIPTYPRHIGLVTSDTGAAVRDILQTIQRRFPCTRITLHPVPVQGEGAAEKIAQAIRRFNKISNQIGPFDTLIIARGGGSLEDLWAFNEETVARAVADSTIPVISAVGHETDITIADLVADLRAPTPTAGAELAVPVLREVLDDLTARQSRLDRSLRHRLDLQHHRLETLRQTPWLRDPMTIIHHAAQSLDETTARLQLASTQHLTRLRSRLGDLRIALAAVQPHTLVQRRLHRLADLQTRLQWLIAARISAGRQHLHKRELTLASLHPQGSLKEARRQVEQAQHALARLTKHRLQGADQTLAGYQARLNASSHQKTLARGFSITRTRPDQRIITRADQVQPGQEILTETAKGQLTSKVIETKDTEAKDNDRN